jgi:4-amino-4-deoxy-L-arabinose transferase-like glycosyltransferase
MIGRMAAATMPDGEPTVVKENAEPVTPAEPAGPIEAPLEPVPRAVWGLAVALFAVLVACAPRYGWHRDELYFREAGRHLAWGYVDQPPLTPAMARIADLVAPDNLVVLRLLPALACVATVVLGALIVREMGGDRRTQAAAAAAVASGGFVLGSGHLLSTATFDLTASMTVLWLFSRLIRTRNPRWWVAIGTAAGVAMLNKNLVVMLLAVAVASLAIDGRRDLLATRWTLVGGAVALGLAAPHLVWQATNGWPQIEMARALSDRIGGENRAMLLPQQVLLVGPILAPLWWWGTRWLWRDPSGRPFRPLLWMWPLALVAVLATGGRPYYAIPLSLVALLAGVRALADRVTRIAVPLAVSAAVALVLSLPVLPVSTARITGAVNETAAETIGWPELVAQVAEVIDRLPAGERDRVVVLTASYGEAGAVDRFGPALGLPPAYSAHNGYHDFRRPGDDGATVVAVRYRPEALAPHFARCEEVASVDNDHDVDNEARGAPLVVCRGLRAPWADTWPRLRHVS